MQTRQDIATAVSMLGNFQAVDAPKNWMELKHVADTSRYGTYGSSHSTPISKFGTKRLERC